MSVLRTDSEDIYEQDDLWPRLPQPSMGVVARIRPSRNGAMGWAPYDEDDPFADVMFDAPEAEPEPLSETDALPARRLRVIPFLGAVATALVGLLILYQAVGSPFAS